jgi:hypothetical protein
MIDAKTGDFYEGESSGTGKKRLIKKCGDMYEGDFKDNKANGEGVFSTLDGYKYTG